MKVRTGVRTIGRFLLATLALTFASIPALVIMVATIQLGQGQYDVLHEQTSEHLARLAIVCGTLLGVWVTTEECALKPLWAFTALVWVLFLLLSGVAMVFSDLLGISTRNPIGLGVLIFLIGVSTYTIADYFVYQTIRKRIHVL